MIIKRKDNIAMEGKMMDIYSVNRFITPSKIDYVKCTYSHKSIPYQIQIGSISGIRCTRHTTIIVPHQLYVDTIEVVMKK